MKYLFILFLLVGCTDDNVTHDTNDDSIVQQIKDLAITSCQLGYTTAYKEMGQPPSNISFCDVTFKDVGKEKKYEGY